MFNDLSSPLAYLRTRRSARPRDLTEPGPSAEQLREMLAIAARSPDHGKLHPWRFLHVRKEDRGAFAALLERAYRAGKAEEPGRLEIEAAHRFAHQAPELVVVLFSPKESSKIPLWEQQLSAGAAAMNLIHAAHAMGFGAGWVTGWAAYSAEVLKGLGASEAERVVGFVFVGTRSAPLEERARPELEEVVSEWRPNSRP